LKREATNCSALLELRESNKGKFVWPIAIPEHRNARHVLGSKRRLSAIDAVRATPQHFSVSAFSCSGFATMAYLTTI
jgi:hypothetical protein